MTDIKILCDKFYFYIKTIRKPLWEECDYAGNPLNSIILSDIEYIADKNNLNIFAIYKRKYAMRKVKMKSGAIAAWNNELKGSHNGIPLVITITFIDTDIYNIEVNINVNYNGECIKVTLFIDEDNEVTYKSEEYECDSNTICRGVRHIVECIRNRIEYIIQDECNY